MKNTLALAMILLGALMVYSGFKNWTLVEAIRFFTGQDDGGVAPEAAGPVPSSGGSNPERTPVEHAEASPAG